jgi:hypothetical protein
MKQNFVAPLPFFHRWVIPLALILSIGLTIHKLVSSEQRYIPLKTSLKQIYTLQNLYHMTHRFYATDLNTLGFSPDPDGYTYSVLVATDASFVVHGAHQEEGSRDVWQIDETGTIRRVIQE